MSKRGQDQDKEIYRELNQAHGNPRILNGQLWSLAGTELGPVHCGRQFCILVCLRGPWKWDQGLSPGHKLAFRAHSLWWEALFKLRVVI